MRCCRRSKDPGLRSVVLEAPAGLRKSDKGVRGPAGIIQNGQARQHAWPAGDDLPWPFILF